MFEFINKRISNFLLKRKLKKRKGDHLHFTDFLKRSRSFLIIFPEDETLFYECFRILKLISRRGNTVTVLTSEFLGKLIPDEVEYSKVVYTDADVDKYSLPAQSLLARIPNAQVDAVLNLNSQKSNFFDAICVSVASKYRVGFKNEGADNCYNFQIPFDDADPENSYKNLLNSLKMF